MHPKEKLSKCPTHNLPPRSLNFPHFSPFTCFEFILIAVSAESDLCVGFTSDDHYKVLRYEIIKFVINANKNKRVKRFY
jgi:hypothetical protein